MDGYQKLYTKNLKLGFWSAIAFGLSLAAVLTFSLLSLPPATTSLIAPPQQAVALEPQEWVPEPPVRLVIPVIDVDAPVQYVGLDANGSGAMAVPSNFTDVGWYEPGVRPGMRGSAVIAGHLNGKDIPEAVFFELDTLEIGDEVVIMSAERIEDIFQVVRIETYAHDDSTEDVFVSTDGKKRLNLITCGGEWLPEEGQYNERTVVFTELLTDVE